MVVEKVEEVIKLDSQETLSLKETEDDEENLSSVIGKSDDKNLLYSIEENPPWLTCIALGFQHYLAACGMIGLTLILSPRLCITQDEAGGITTAMIISTVFFTAGIFTVLQTTIGVRLPILQGSSVNYLVPTLALLALPHNQCPVALVSENANNSIVLYNDTDGVIKNADEVWMSRMREVQGAITVASLLQVFLGASGTIGLFLRYIGPLTVMPTVTLLGLHLFVVAYEYASVQWGIASLTIVLMILFSQYLKNINVLLPKLSLTNRNLETISVPVFKAFPVMLSLVIAWTLSIVLTATGAFSSDPTATSYRARTDIRTDVVANSPWFRFPYPGQWGMPKVTLTGAVGMIAGVVAGMVESVGDYYACARLSGAPTPPTHAINRGVLVEGFACVLDGLIGTGTGTTSLSQNIGVIGITRVGSRRVLQVTGVLFIILGAFCKFGSVFAIMPDPIAGGMFCVMFGMIVASGLSNLQFVDLNSPRNLFIIGFTLFMGLAIPGWVKSNPNVILTGVEQLDQIIIVLLQTPMLVGAILAMVLDNTIPGTEEERGLKLDQVNDPEGRSPDNGLCYNLPYSPKHCGMFRYLPFMPHYYSEDVTKDAEVSEL